MATELTYECAKSGDDDMRCIFEKFGELEVCRVVMDWDTEHSRGKWQLS